MTTTDEHFGLLGPIGGVAGPRRRRRPEPGRDPRGGHAADAVDRDLAGALDDRRRAPAGRAARTERRACPRRRRPVRRGDPDHHGRRRLPHDLRAEVALRTGRHGRARRARPRACWRSSHRATSAQARHEPDGVFERQPDARRFESGWWSQGTLRGMLAAIELRPDVVVRPLDRGSGALPRAPRAAGRGRHTGRPPRRSSASGPRRSPPAIVARAHEAGVHVREIPGRGLVRISCGWWTSDEDLDRLVSCARGLTAVRRRRRRRCGARARRRSAGEPR